MRTPAHAVIRSWAVCVMLASAAQAEVSCQMRDPDCAECAPVDVRFAIDPAQFVAPQHPDDPPRRQITTVTLGDVQFTAQAIMMAGGIVGFFEEAEALGNRLMIVQADGTARLSQQPAGRVLSGVCQRR